MSVVQVQASDGVQESGRRLVMKDRERGGSASQKKKARER